MKSYGVTIQIKPLQQYFHMVLFVRMRFWLLRLWMESYGVTIQIKPLQQYFHTLQFIKYLVPLLSLCMKSYENETRQQYSHMGVFFLSPWADSSCVAIPWNETLLAALLHKTIHLFEYFLKNWVFVWIFSFATIRHERVNKTIDVTFTRHWKNFRPAEKS